MRLVLLLSMFVVFASCKKGSETEAPEIREPFWRETHLFFDGELCRENDEFFVQEYSIDVPEEDAYEMTLLEDGSGWGSGPIPEGVGRYDFDLNWTMSEGKFTLNIFSKSGSFDGMFLSFGKEGQVIPQRSTWDIEEYTDDKLVLSIQGEAHYDTDYAPIDLPLLLRWTFEKVGPEEQ